jgi:hypothetical protein
MFGDIRRHARDIPNSSIQRKTSFQPVNGYLAKPSTNLSLALLSRDRKTGRPEKAVLVRL